MIVYPHVITIFSEKGGVGKTTTSLELAKFLQTNEFTVFLFDLDITGTNISLSGIEKYYSNIHSNINIIKNKNRPINLLEIFENYINDNVRKNYQPNLGNFKHSVKKNYINIIGSSIFNDIGKVIFEPDILYDSIHTLIFIEFLKEIYENLKKICKNEKIVIIFDTSSGYTGLNNEIQEWLTDLGSNIGKFLIVSSLDNQDLINNYHLLKRINQKAENKYHAYLSYLKVKNNQIDEDLENDIEKITANNEQFDYYYRLITNLVIPPIDNWSSNSSSTSKFLGWIINRVPLEIKTGLHKITFNENLNDPNILNIISKNYQINQDLMISNDVILSNQFIPAKINESEMISRIIDMSNFIKNKMDDQSIGEQMSLLDSYFINLNSIKQKNEVVKGYANSIFNTADILLSQTIEHLKFNGFGSIADFISPKWKPSYIIDLYNAIISEFEDKNFNGELFEPFNPIRFNPTQEISIRNEIIKAISFIIYNRDTYVSRRHNNFHRDELLKRIIDFQEKHYLQSKFYKNNAISNEDLASFLANDKISLKEYSLLDEHFRDNYPYQIFNKKYKLLSQIESRYLTLDKDVHFILSLIKFLIERTNYEKKIVIPIDPIIIDDIIVNKTETYLNDDEMMKRIKIKSQNIEFTQIFQKLLKEWEVYQ